MIEIDIHILRIEDTDHVIGRVESVLAAHELSMHTRGTLRSFPGSIHWHWKNGRQAGTLEVTLWPAKRRLWFKVQSARRAMWIDQLIPVLKADLESG